MAKRIGFSDVDTSARASELVDYLGRLADKLAGMRREDYARLSLGPGASVLDVGCGAGEVCIELAAQVGPRGRASGVDASEAMISAARAAAEKAGRPVDLRVASAYSLPFPDGSFDAVRAERVFQHLDDPARALAEMLRVAKPGGRVMVVDPDHSQCGVSLETELQCRAHEASRSALLRLIANPRIGTRLRGLFLDAGLGSVEQVVRALELPYPDYVHATFLEDRLALAVAEGEITEEESRRFLAELETQHRQGRFCAIVLGYTVVGEKDEVGAQAP